MALTAQSGKSAIVSGSAVEVSAARRLQRGGGDRGVSTSTARRVAVGGGADILDAPQLQSGSAGTLDGGTIS